MKFLNREEAKQMASKKLICKQSQIPFLKIIDVIFNQFENQKTCDGCINTKTNACYECSRSQYDFYEPKTK